MTTGIYLSATTPQSGKALVALGLAETLKNEFGNVGYLRAVYSGATPEEDTTVELIRKQFGFSAEQARGAVSLKECRKFLAKGDLEGLSSEVVTVYSEMAEKFDVIIVDGTDLLAHNAATIEFDLNAQIARDLGIPVSAVIGAQNAFLEDIVNAVEVTATQMRNAHLELMSVVVNRVDASSRDDIAETLSEQELNLTTTVLSEVPGFAELNNVEDAIKEYKTHGSVQNLIDTVRAERKGIVTPLHFLHGLIESARSNRRSVVLPEGYDPRVLTAAAAISKQDFCDLVLIGNPEKIKEAASAEGIELPEQGIRIIDLDNNEYNESFAEEYAKLRAHKGVTVEQAAEKMKDPSYFGTILVKQGIVDGMVSGAVNTTANTIRPSLEFVKTREGVNIVSSVFLMLTQDRGVLVFGDCAVNPNPNGAQLADIAKASAETARQFGVDPKVAMLSYSTGTSGQGPDVEIVKEAVATLKEADVDFPFEGPIQFDAASNMSIASSKLPGSEVAGQATVFIFPDLNTGNNTYKAVQQTSGAVAVGPVLQGLRKPVNDLSRGCTVDDIINTVAITAIQAQTL